jgi:hypothetical protein
MKAVKSFHNDELSGLKLSTLSRIVDSVTIPELKATENDVKRVFKGWGK